MDGEDKGADVQEEHSVHGLVGEAMQPPHMEHMSHGHNLQKLTHLAAMTTSNTATFVLTLTACPAACCAESL